MLVFLNEETNNFFEVLRTDILSSVRMNHFPTNVVNDGASSIVMLLRPASVIVTL